MLFAPQIIKPVGGDVFNLGVVDIQWLTNDPPSTDLSISSDDVFYEIEYTDDYKGSSTYWRSLKRRIVWSTTAFSWPVGKMIKGRNFHIRMRSHISINQLNSVDTISDWSISDSFTVNTFDLVAPPIVNPVSNNTYTDFIIIILDESLSKDTYRQKVRYTLEYSSDSRDISWTTIVDDIPVGQNIIRWDISSVLPADDYILRLTAVDSSGKTGDGIMATSFVYDIKIRQSGLFLIDTKPPEAIIEIENNTRITNNLDQVISVFAEDETTEVEQLQLRECEADASLVFGDVGATGSTAGATGCAPLTSFIGATGIHLGKSISNNSKIKWTFDDQSGLRKIEALLFDSGGNSSFQESTNVFVPIFTNDYTANDFLITVEIRDTIVIDDSNNSINIVPVTLEVMYIGMSNGDLVILEPFQRIVYNIANEQILKLAYFNDTLFLLTYSSVGKFYRHDIINPTLLYTFSDPLSIPSCVAEFDSKLYIGFKNGELWSYDGHVFSNIAIPTVDPISALYCNGMQLCIGFQNSDNILLYDGLVFITLNLES